jgi:hypothetical protein
VSTKARANGLLQQWDAVFSMQQHIALIEHMATIGTCCKLPQLPRLQQLQSSCSCEAVVCLAALVSSQCSVPVVACSITLFLDVTNMVIAQSAAAASTQRAQHHRALRVAAMLMARLCMWCLVHGYTAQQRYSSC